MNNAEVTIVIPLFRAVKYLSILRELLSTNEIVRTCQFLLVNDGCQDLKAELQNLSRTFSNVKHINLIKNVGQHRASAIGIENSCTDIVCTLDQDFIEQLPKFISYFGIKPAVGELFYLTLKKSHRHILRAFSSRVLLYSVKIFGGYDIPGVYSARIVRKVSFDKAMGFDNFILDLELLDMGLKPVVVETNISVLNKESSYRFSQLLKVFHVSVLYYTKLYELVVIGLIIISIILNYWFLMGTLIIVLLALIVVKLTSRTKNKVEILIET